MLEKTANKTRSARRNRRRLTAWIAFAAVGIIMGAVWATGFASIGGATGTTVASPAVTSGAASNHTSALSGTATADSPFTVNWTGRWGSVAATNFFKVNLTGKTGTFNVAMLLSNDIAAGGWETLQLNVENVQEASGTADCSGAVTTFDGTQQNKVMVFDSRDAGVYWNALAGDKVYCIGVAASNGQNTSGTFLRSASDSAPTIYPTFITTVDRAS
jgi:hypothetical protein